MRLLISLSAFPLSKLDEDQPQLTLAQAYKKFFELHQYAQLVLKNKDQAETHNARVVRDLYEFFKSQDIDSEVWMGKVFVKKLVDASSVLTQRVKDSGELNAQKSIRHAVVKVNQLAIDPCHLRLGSMYTHLDNYPFRDFNQYFVEVEDIKHLISMTPEKIATILNHIDEKIDGMAKPSNTIRAKPRPNPTVFKQRREAKHGQV